MQSMPCILDVNLFYVSGTIYQSASHSFRKSSPGVRGEDGRKPGEEMWLSEPAVWYFNWLGSMIDATGPALGCKVRDRHSNPRGGLVPPIELNEGLRSGGEFWWSSVALGPTPVCRVSDDIDGLVLLKLSVHIWSKISWVAFLICANLSFHSCHAFVSTSNEYRKLLLNSISIVRISSWEMPVTAAHVPMVYVSSSKNLTIC